jgi:hypothetical protein
MAAPAAQGTQGFVYVATGELFFREAAEAVRRLRAANPGARVCLVADRAAGEPFWDDLVVIEQPAFDFRDKLHLARCPYDRFVFLDTDTHVAGDLGELFELLRGHDVIGHQLFEGHDYRMAEAPDVFPEFNTGVLGFRRGPAVERLFVRWRELYTEYRARNTGGHYDYANVSDQKSFRVALYQSGVRTAVLGPEFNFIVQHVQFACAAVKILHGRPFSELERIERVVNARLGQRAWVPILDLCVRQHQTAGGWARIAFRAGLQTLRMAGLVVLPAGWRRRFREMPVLRRLFLRNEEPAKVAGEHKRKWGLEG